MIVKRQGANLVGMLPSCCDAFCYCPFNRMYYLHLINKIFFSLFGKKKKKEHRSPTILVD